MHVRARIPHRIVVTEKSPVLRETNYDRVSSAAWTVFFGLLAICVVLIVLWAQIRMAVANPPRTKRVPIQTVRFERNDRPLPDLVVVSPETDDPENMVESDKLNQMLVVVGSSAAHAEAVALNSGVEQDEEQGDDQVTGDLVKTTRRVVDHNWLFEIKDLNNDADYKRMLNHFGIELAAVFADGRVVYLSTLGTTPAIRQASDFSDEQRFFTFWNDGGLRDVEQQLFAAAGIDTTGAKQIQLLPPALEDRLAELERNFGNKSADQIRNTWFRLIRTGGTYDFEVTRQTLLQN